MRRPQNLSAFRADRASRQPQEHLSGALGDGAGKWHLTVDAPFETAVMSLLDTPTGFITNLSRPSDN